LDYRFEKVSPPPFPRKFCVQVATKCGKKPAEQLRPAQIEARFSGGLFCVRARLLARPALPAAVLICRITEGLMYIWSACE
jgi:hypothetical protein